MKALTIFLFLGLSLGWTQAVSTLPSGPPDTVVATCVEDGTKITLGEFQAMVPALPNTWNALATRDPQRFLHVYCTMLKGAALAKSQKLAEKTPYKEALAFAMLSSLTDAYVRESTSALTVTQDEIEKYYNQQKPLYKRITVSGIRVAYGGNEAPADPALMASKPPKKVLTEAEAKAKAEKLVVQLRAGADFKKMVQQESDDEASKAKGGDLGTWSMTDNVPDLMRSTVLSLGQGEVSDPVQQAGAFYIFHGDAVTFAPLADVKDAIFDGLQAAKGKAWVEDFDKSTKVIVPEKKDPPPPSEPKK